MALSIHNTSGATDLSWQLEDKCDMVYMLVSLRDHVWHSNKLKDEQKLHHIVEVAPVISNLMKEVIEDKERLRKKREKIQEALQG